MIILKSIRMRPAIWLAQSFFAFLLVLAAWPAQASEFLNGEGVLWKIESDRTAPSHVFGTMHSDDPRVLDMPDAADLAFANADLVALEVLIAEPAAQMELGMKLSPVTLMTDGRTLDELIGRERSDAVAKALAPHGVPGFAAQMFRPWVAYLILSVPPPRKGPNGEELPRLDGQLELDARAQGKQLAALETIDEQVALFRGFDEEQEIRLLKEMVDFAEAQGGMRTYFDATFARVVDLYENGEIGKIIEMTETTMSDSDAALLAKMLDRLLYDRNVIMVERMQSLIGRGNAFIAIGAAHLPGERGVINLLEQDGYKVTRVH